MFRVSIFGFRIYLMRYRLIIFTVIGILVLLAVLAFVFGRKGGGGEAISLEFWGTGPAGNWSQIIAAYQKDNPQVSVKYIAKDASRYERDLVEALAAGVGPDIAVINNVWLGKHLNKLSPAPSQVLSIATFKDSFADSAHQDLIRAGKIYAVPFYIDTLALYYNKAFYNNAGLVSPPKTWEEFSDAVKKLTQKDEGGNIVRSGAALGTAANINYASDILNLLMMQTGATMVSKDGRQVLFDRTVSLQGKNYSPGLAALDFYTSFALSTKPVYTWNARMPGSLKAFTEGKTAMYIGYAKDLKAIRNSLPNFGVAPMPQIKDSRKDSSYLDINWASYQAGAVMQSSTKKEAAWRFLSFAVGRDSAGAYLRSAYLPPARKDLIEFTASDALLNIFAKQILTAANWFQPDEAEVRKIFERTINAVTLNQTPSKEALREAASEATNLLR